MTEFEFHSTPVTHMVALIKRNRALGYRYDEGVRILKRFDAFCLECFPEETTVTKEMLDVRIFSQKRNFNAFFDSLTAAITRRRFRTVI